MTSNYFLKKLSSYNNRDVYVCWKDNIKIFIEGMYCDIWVIVKKKSFVPTHLVDGVVEKKSR